VCGSDGNTYSNPCDLRRAAACNGDATLVQAFVGECVDCDRFCSEDWTPVCGSDGTTYGNICQMEVAACNLGTALTPHPEGECGCQQVCPTQWLPVCGSDGVTYSTSCFLAIAACNGNATLVQAFEGECVDCDQVCTRDKTPVCGSDGNTYSNPCDLRRAAACNGDATLVQAFVGECVGCDPEQICPAQWLPVCGSDGVIYSNSCELAVAACGNAALVEAATDECATNLVECEDDASTFTDFNTNLTCAFVGSGDQRRNYWCNRPMAKHFCPVMCDMCGCRDNEDATMILGSNGNVSCLELARYSLNKINYWCDRDDIGVQTLCPSTCSAC